MGKKEEGEQDRRKLAGEDVQQECSWCGMLRDPWEFEDGLRCIYCAEEGEGGLAK